MVKKTNKPWETHFKYKDRIKVKGWRKIFHVHDNQKRAGWLLNIRPIDFKSKKFTRDKVHYILIKGLNQQEDTTVINITNKGAPVYVKQKLTELKRDRQFYNRLQSSVPDFY